MKRKTLEQRARSAMARQKISNGYDFIAGWMEGYRAAKRDARKARRKA